MCQLVAQCVACLLSLRSITRSTRLAAAELFDWLRALPRDHQLSKLADLYTYTTLISQVRCSLKCRRKHADAAWKACGTALAYTLCTLCSIFVPTQTCPHPSIFCSVAATSSCAVLWSSLGRCAGVHGDRGVHPLLLLCGKSCAY